LRTTRSTQPVEAPTQHASIGEGSSLEGATSNGDLWDFLPGEDSEQSLCTLREVDTDGMCNKWLYFFNNSKYIFQTLILYFSSTYTAGSKRKRGVTRMANIWNLQDDEQVVVEFNALGQPIGDQGGSFNNFFGTLVRDKNIVLIDYSDWRKVPKRHKEDAWNILQVMNFCFTLTFSLYFEIFVKLQQ